jgi:hypothetical protein
MSVHPLVGAAAILGGSSILGGLLGRKKSGGGQIKTETVPRWSPEQQQLFSQMYGLVQSRLGQPWQLTPTKEESSYMEFLRGYEPWYRQLMSEVYDPTALKQYYQTTVYPEWESEVAPRVRSEYAGPGYWGSERARGVAESLTGIGREEARALLAQDLARQQALAQLAQLEPAAMEQLAQMSRRFAPVEPIQSPYYQAAAQLLGYDPYYIVGGMATPQPSPFSYLLPGIGYGLGSMLPGLLSSGALSAGGGLGALVDVTGGVLPWYLGGMTPAL